MRHHKLLQNYKPHNMKSLLKRTNSIKIQQTHIVRTGFQVFTLVVSPTAFWGFKPCQKKKKGGGCVCVCVCSFRHFRQMCCLYFLGENLVQADA